MDLAGVLLVRRRPADDGAQRDERRAARLRLGGQQRLVQLLDVLVVVALVGVAAPPVDRLHVPAVRRVAGRHVLAQRDAGVVLDRDLVVVVDHAEVAQLLVPGQGAGLVADALLDVAVGGDAPDVVVEDRLTGLGLRVEQAALAAGRHGHADGVAQPLPERAGGGLHARGVAVLGVPRGERAPLPQRLQVVQVQRVAGEEELDVKGQAGVAGGEHEAVPAGPERVGGAVSHDPVEQQVRRRSEAHRGARVAVAGFLHGVHGQHADGVHGTAVEIGPVEWGVGGSVGCHGGDCSSARWAEPSLVTLSSGAESVPEDLSMLVCTFSVAGRGSAPGVTVRTVTGSPGQPKRQRVVCGAVRRSAAWSGRTDLPPPTPEGDYP